jgi:hypothetical protein
MGFAGLLHLRGIYAVEPDLRFPNTDGVAINNTRLAFKVVSLGYYRD